MEFHITYEGNRAQFAPGDTVLDALERAGVTVPSSCRAGACQFCLMRVVEGEVPKRSQEGLKESLQNTGHFLSCICRPERDIACEAAHTAAFRGHVTIQDIEMIGQDVASVRFERPEGLTFAAGQFVTLRREDGLARSYSLVSRAHEGAFFEIHVRHVPNGRLSGWFHKEARPRDVIWAEGPKGDCMYYPGKPEEPLTLVGTGTGIAPLAAIAEDALACGHEGPITIYHGAVSENRFYWRAEMAELAARHGNVTYVPCVLQGPASADVKIGELKKIVVADLTDAHKQRVYLCGDPGLVRILKKHIFLAGVSLGRLHADPFIGTDAP